MRSVIRSKIISHLHVKYKWSAISHGRLMVFSRGSLRLRAARLCARLEEWSRCELLTELGDNDRSFLCYAFILKRNKRLKLVTIHQKIAAGFVTFAFILISVFPDRAAAAVTVVVSVVLYGALVFLDHKDDRKNEIQTKRISELEEKMNALMFSKGMHR